MYTHEFIKAQLEILIEQLPSRSAHDIAGSLRDLAVSIVEPANSEILYSAEFPLRRNR